MVNLSWSLVQDKAGLVFFKSKIISLAVAFGASFAKKRHDMTSQAINVVQKSPAITKSVKKIP
jgi:hypothetical protein